ncbi:MAG TPA: hypothetical protein VFT21_09020 [Gemmatimonadaceae bacterium]|nr:hypothetical protein [Gemmatimonadaceae bacterium]
MRFLLASFSTFVFLACSTAPAARSGSPIQEEPLSSTVEFLLTSAVTDFSHMPALPPSVRFRDVRTGYTTTSEIGKQYRLCGSFSPALDGKDGWTPFVTIKTSGYEQYLGAQAVSECTREGITWDKRDLSSLLQSQLARIR